MLVADRGNFPLRADVLELGAKDHGLHACSIRVVGKEIAKVGVVEKGATRHLRRVTHFALGECAIIESKVPGHKGAA